MDVEKTLLEVIEEFNGGRGVTMAATESTTFDELDLDSLDRVDLLMQIEDKFSITFGDDLSVNTVGELVAKIKELQK